MGKNVTNKKKYDKWYLISWGNSILCSSIVSGTNNILLTTDVNVLNHVLFEYCAISSDLYCWQISSNDHLMILKKKQFYNT